METLSTVNRTNLLYKQIEQLRPGAKLTAENKFEHPKDFGKWTRLGSSDGDSILFNSSHIYPLSIQGYLNTVDKFAAEEPYAPLFLELRPTNICNHNCPFCFAHETRGNYASLSQERVSNLIEESQSLGIPVIRFCGGGEPLTWSNIDKVIEKTDKADMGTVLITNGGLLGRYYENLVEHSRYIRISINGGPNTHHIFHGCSSEDFPKILQTMRKVSAIRTGQSDIANRLYLGTTYLVFPENIDEVYTTARLVKDAGWDAVYFRSPTPSVDLTEGEKLKLEEQKEKCKELTDETFFPHFAGRLFGLNTDSRTNRCFCYHSQLRLYVEPTGNTSFCGLFSVTELNSLGDVNKERLVKTSETPALF